jgi:hypothetical protein
MPSARSEPATPATKRPQTYALDRAATEIGQYLLKCTNYRARHEIFWNILSFNSSKYNYFPENPIRRMGTRGPFIGGKARPSRDADHSPPSSGKVVNE